MGFDAGALIFKIQAAGAQLFQRDMDQADRSIRKVEGSAKAAKPALEGQGKATDDVGAKSRKASEDQNKQAQATEGQIQAAKTLSLALIAGGAAITAVVGLSIAKFTSFDAQMSNTRAATMATTEEQKRLADAALDAGADTAYSANEAAAAEEELAKAGLNVSEVVGGALTGSLALAAAGQLQVARSAEVMATTLKQFKLPASDAAHVSDLLAAGAGKAQGSVEDLANALKFVGPVANGLGISLEETTGILALFAEQGIIGEQAGTSLRGVLSSLTSPSKIAADTMKQYGIEIFNANGSMKSGAEIAQQLKNAFGKLTEAERAQALGRIFGNEQITAARILYQGGADAVEKWTAAVDDSGYAAEQAAIRQDNLAGDIEKLGGAFDSALIRTGAGANDVLREMVQSVTAMVDAYGEAPAEVQATALVLGVLTGAVLLASGSALGLTARFTELRAQLERNNISMGKTAAIGGAVGLALAGIVTVVAILAQKQAEARAKAEGYADAISDSAAAVRDFAESNLKAEKSLAWLNFGSAYDNADKLGISLDLVTDAATGNADAMEKLNKVLETATGGGEAAAKMADELGISQLDLAQSAGTLREQIDEEASAQERAKTLREQAARVTEEQTSVTQTATEAYTAAADEAANLNTQLSDLVDTINEANGVGQDAITSNLDYQDALAKVDEQIQKAKEGAEGYVLSLDESSQAGRDNKAMLVDLAEQSQEAAKAQFDLDGNTNAYRASLEAGRQALIDRARELGLNAEQAAALADQIYRIPSETEWKLIADTVPAENAINGVINRFDGRTITLRIGAQGQQTYSYDGGRTILEADGGNVRFYANGGRDEHHVAQFARAGDYRVWAEPETGGEWYLPDSPAKRDRSVMLAQQMLDGWGFQMVPKGAQAFADGTTPAQAGAAPQGPVNLHLYDADGVLLGIIRSTAEQVSTAASRARTRTLEDGSRRK